MSGRIIHLLLLAVVPLLAWSQEEEYVRERYDVITERSPFGEDPLIAQQAEQDARAAAEASKLARQMEKKIRLCYLLETDRGEVRAGFENKGAKTGDPKSIMLRVNESFQGMKLTEVDLVGNSATLTMNGKPVTFELTQAAAAPAQNKPEQKTTTRRLGSGFKRSQPQEQEEQPQLTAEERAAQREEVTKRLQEYQMEVLRQGMPPLPVPLTQDMDDQLVAEGVLPALD